MILELASSAVAGGILGATWLSKSGGTSEAAKIQEIFQNSGLSKRGGSIHLQRKSRKDWGTEYAYRIPLGLSFEDFQSKQNAFRDGLNNRRTLNISWEDFKEIDWRGNIIEQIRWLFTKNGKQKEIEMEYDGLLKIRVYNEPMPDRFPWNPEFFEIGWRELIGKSKTGYVYHDFEVLPNLLVAGTPGFGKSQFLKSLITSLIYRKPESVKFTLIDLKEGVSFSRFRDCRQVEGRVACNEGQAIEALKSVQSDMNATYNRLVSDGYEDVKEAGIKERHFVVIDEAADIADDKEAMEIIKDIARRGRAAGIRLVYSTQYPTMEAIPSQIKRNITTRLSFVLDSSTASQTVLDVGGAEELPDVPGRAIYKRLRKEVVQTPMIENEKIKETINPHIKARDEDASTPNRKADGENSIDVEEI